MDNYLKKMVYDVGEEKFVKVNVYDSLKYNLILEQPLYL